MDNQTPLNDDEKLMKDLENATNQKSQKSFSFKSLALVFVPVLLFGLLISTLRSDASQITNRTLTLGSSVASASTTYTFTFTVPSATVIKSFAADICTTASGTCTTPAGFSNGTSTLSSQPTNLGDAAGWTVDTSTSGSLRISKAGNAAAPAGSQTVVFGSVTNPSATNSTFFARLTTYSDASWTTPIDTGTVASSTAGQITVTASVDEALTFTIASPTVALGTLTPSSTGSGTSTMTASTNAANGYAITVNGSTLTSGANTITALNAQAASSQGTEQFGVNLVANLAPTIGTDVNPSYSATTSLGRCGQPSSGYNTADSFKFVSSDTVASASCPSISQTYTVSYIANISEITKPGSYSTALTYIMSATF